MKDPQDFLEKEYDHFAESFWKNEETGERKLNIFIGLTTIIATAVILLVPVGTPLTIGCGFVYKSVYGWRWGVFIATLVSMAGSICGAVSCFLLGRYLMRDHVRTWIRKYPMFVAIDIGKHTIKQRERANSFGL